MTPSPQPDDRDPLSAYVDGDPEAVRAAHPPEPGEAAWETVRLRIHARLAPPAELPSPRRRIALWGAVGAALTAAAAVVAWVAVRVPPAVDAPEVVETRPLAPAPHDATPDPLAEFAVLPMASDDEVVLHRVPGDGWLPVGTPLLPGELALATASEVELDDPDPAWPAMTKTPADAPMIFAAKPR